MKKGALTAISGALGNQKLRDDPLVNTHVSWCIWGSFGICYINLAARLPKDTSPCVATTLTLKTIYETFVGGLFAFSITEGVQSKPSVRTTQETGLNPFALGYNARSVVICFSLRMQITHSPACRYSVREGLMVAVDRQFGRRCPRCCHFYFQLPLQTIIVNGPFSSSVAV